MVEQIASVKSEGLFPTEHFQVHHPVETHGIQKLIARRMAALQATLDTNGFLCTFPCLCVCSVVYLHTAADLTSVLCNSEEKVLSAL